MKSRRAPFTLTPYEEKIISLKRAGKTTKEIFAAIGVSGKVVSGTSINAAVEKDRLRRLPDLRRHRGETSLSVARGNVRMEGTK